MRDSHRSARRFCDVPPPLGGFRRIDLADLGVATAARPPWSLSILLGLVRSKPTPTCSHSSEWCVCVRGHPLPSPCSLLEVPSTGNRFDRPLQAPAACASVAVGLLVPPSKSCSALVVSHHLDGFLRSCSVGLLHPTADPGVHRVSANRSPGRDRLRRVTRSGRSGGSPRCAHPSKMLPVRSASTTHRCDSEEPRVTSWRYPRAVGRRSSRSCSRGASAPFLRPFSTRLSTSRRCSADRSVAAACRFQQPTTLFSHGLLLPPSATSTAPARMAL